jgi:hypothetical protein
MVADSYLIPAQMPIPMSWRNMFWPSSSQISQMRRFELRCSSIFLTF